MTKKLNDVAPVKPLFAEAEKVKKDDVVGKELKVLAYAKLTSDDGDYGVIEFMLENKKSSCTINTSMLERMEEVAEKIGLNEARTTKKELYLSEPILVTIKSEETSKKRTFYSFE